VSGPGRRTVEEVVLLSLGVSVGNNRHAIMVRIRIPSTMKQVMYIAFAITVTIAGMLRTMMDMFGALSLTSIHLQVQALTN
jgi:hypothetical protein